MRTFDTYDGAVHWIGKHPVRLTPESVDGLLDILDREGACELYNELYEAQACLEGSIVRLTSMRPWKPTLRLVEAEP